jgi:RimJ/RimL family protein N-acetyltransferase
MHNPEVRHEVPERKRKPLEFIGENGLILSEMTEDNASEFFEFVEENREILKTFVPQEKLIQNEHDALASINDKNHSTLGIRLESGAPLAGYMTMQQEPEDRVAIGVCVGEKFLRQGIASNAIMTLSGNILKTRFKVVRAYAHPENHIIRSLLNKNGFTWAGGTPHKNVFYDLDDEGYLDHIKKSRNLKQHA